MGKERARKSSRPTKAMMLQREVAAYQRGLNDGIDEGREAAERHAALEGRLAQSRQALIDMPPIAGSPEAVVELYTLADVQPARLDLTGTDPQAWDCNCGPAHNSAVVEVCPTCHTIRPYDYTPPQPENAPFIAPVKPDWPQPNETPDDYARRMGKDGYTRNVELPAESGSVSTTTIPIVSSGYYCPIEFAGPVGSVAVDPALLQQALDLMNAAAKTAAVQSVTLGIKSPQQARLVLRADFDLGEAQVRTVRDE